MKFRFSLFLVPLTLSVSLFANANHFIDPKGVEVSQLYLDRDGNAIVSFRYGPKALGINLLFWKPGAESNFYQLQEVSTSIDPSRSEHQFMAPNLSDVNKKAIIKIENNNLVIESDGKSHFFQRAEVSRQIDFESAIQSQELKLVGLPKTRKPEYLFKIAGTSTYILVDRPRYNYYNTNFEVSIGEKGHIQKAEVVHVSRLMNGETTIELADGTTIKVPARGRESAKIIKSPQSVGDLLLEPQALTTEFFVSSGIDLKRFGYRISEIRTPVSGPGQLSRHDRCVDIFR